MRRVLTLADREEISRGVVESSRCRGIAARIGCDASIVSREVDRHGGRDGYRAVAADGAAGTARSRPKPPAVDRNPVLRSRVVGLLRAGRSPASIAGRLARDHDGGDAVQVSREAVQQWVYVPPVATVNRELIVLRTGRADRRGPRPAPAPRIRESRYPDERPVEAEGRAVPGHREGDLVVGKGGTSAVATLVERTSRFLVLVPLRGRGPLDRGRGDPLRGRSPPGLDQAVPRVGLRSRDGLHEKITATGLPVFFARPHSPRERGGNENLNREADASTA